MDPGDYEMGIQALGVDLYEESLYYDLRQKSSKWYVGVCLLSHPAFLETPKC